MLRRFISLFLVSFVLVSCGGGSASVASVSTPISDASVEASTTSEAAPVAATTAASTSFSYSKDFDAATNEEIQFHTISFHVPRAWEEGSQEEDTLYFYPSNGMLMVQCDASTIITSDSLSSEENMTAFYDSFSAGFDNCEIGDSRITSVVGVPARQFDFTAALGGYGDINGTVDIFPLDDVLYIFVIVDFDARGTYDKDFQQIITSIVHDGKDDSSAVNLFDPSSNLKGQLGELSYEIPKVWPPNVSSSSDTTKHYSIPGGMFGVIIQDNEDTDDPHSDVFEKTLIDTFSESSENMEVLSTEKITVDGFNGLRTIFTSDTKNGGTQYSEITIIHTPKHVYSLMLIDTSGKDQYSATVTSILENLSIEVDEAAAPAATSPDEPFWTYSGSGDDVFTGPVTPDMYCAMKITHTGKGHFAVKAHHDSTYELLVNTSDPYNGGLTMLEPNKEYTIEVTGKGAWEMEAYVLGDTDSDVFEGIQGDYVTPLFDSTSDVYEIETKGKGHIAIKGYYAIGRYDLLLNTTDDNYSGKVMFKHKGNTCFFVIESKREVTIKPAN